MTDHTDFAAKLDIRRDADQSACTWVPFCGGGYLTRALQYRRVHACDTDSKRLQEFRDNCAHLDISRVDRIPSQRFLFGTEIYSHLDIDAYYSPYQSLEHAIRNAQLTDPFTVALTDGTRQSRVREHHVYRFATHSAHRDPTQSRHQDCRWDAIVAAWIPTLAVEIIDTRATGSKWMRYQFYKMRRQQNDNRSYRLSTDNAEMRHDRGGHSQHDASHETNMASRGNWPAALATSRNCANRQTRAHQI